MSLQYYNIVKIIYKSLKYIKIKGFAFNSQLCTYQNTTLSVEEKLPKLEETKLIFIYFSFSFNRFRNIITGTYIIIIVS